ncbi:MAG TPA: tetratricopeptide repeat protein [Candidatus Sulfotelmatobacter sp.]|nr:tetratricopeptide repeat protein [Candidatus Sulfotelmatobacter sp.]
MALFGFNKQKVLASAEKYVQQGKLQNAISEYEKVLKNDPKDLTVNNTVGDLYSRLGETDKATECFKSVGDAYAGQGFTVKAIAMYKKICKLKPSLESLLKLAELYTQQGLFNDARSQYLQVAEEFLKANELENAVRIFQKILEMDPENSSMRLRLAEVYVRLGKKKDAWQIFTQAAETLRSKGSLNEAEDVLQRMLKLDPGNTYALLMQGRNLLESGDAAGAVATLQKISDIDSNPEGLRDLLKAYLQSGQLSEAGTVANKLLTVHNDLPAISSFADALMQAGQYENALQVFDQHAERLLSENSSKMLESLYAVIGHVRDNPDSLQKLLDLFNKAGDTSHVSEVMELLAHASVQAGDLTRSRDLYQKLAQVEPQNPLHMQNYQQVVSQIGGTSGAKLITPEEAVVLLDDLEATAPAIHQHYSDEVALAVRSALTDAELFISYNMPAKGLAPLLAVLPQAPDDLRLNQRLATLHTRAGRFAEAAVCCRTLQRVYSEADYPEEATRYGELAQRYEERTAVPPPASSQDEAPIFLDAPAPTAQDSEPEIAEFSVDETAAEVPAPEPEAAEEQHEARASAASPWPAPAKLPAAPEFAVVDESATAADSAGPEEIDLSSEWDDTLTVEAEAPAPADEKESEVEAAAAPAMAVPASPAAKAAAPMADAAVDEAAEEIHFYIAHSMLEQAMATLAKLQTLTKNKAKLDGLRAEIEAASAAAVEQEIPVAPEPVLEELTADDVPSFEVVEESPVAVEQRASDIPEPEPVEPAPIVADVPVEPVVARPEPVRAKPAPTVPKPAPVAAKPAPVIHEPEPEAQPAVLKKFVTDLESSLGDGFLPGTVSKPAPAPAAPAPSKTDVAATPGPPALGEFVADIEASLGEDFLAAAPVPEHEAPAARAAAVPSRATSAAPKITPLAASAAASAAPTSHVSPPTLNQPAPIASVSGPVVGAPKPQPPAPIIPPAAPAASKASPFGEDAGVDLAEMFGELKQDLEADVASADEDPETHYNLGIAFREMGLLDEAIGELQKACQSFDKGHAFPQIMQTYTWLAQCFLEKGVPEAAVRWYEKALNVAAIDGETRTALNYELAAAYEAAGNKSAALQHFMDVYGSNIDYRDVAERIKALKS